MGNNTSVLNIYGDYRDFDMNYSLTSQDYFVHMLRFSKVVDQVKGKNIFDIGCGKYTNLLKALCMMERGPDYRFYIGTDYNKCKKWREDYEAIWGKTVLLDELDFTDEDDFGFIMDSLVQAFEGEPFVITCFEVLEHMDFEMQNKFLYNLSRLLHNPKLNVECCMFSTPNFNGYAAKNHVSELSWKLLEEMFSRYGIIIAQAQGLSAWKKYHKQEYLAPGCNPPKYAEFMPVPLQKMIWGAALPRKYSNNILYNLMPDLNELKSYDEYKKLGSYSWGEFRQGGSSAAICDNPDNFK